MTTALRRLESASRGVTLVPTSHPQGATPAPALHPGGVTEGSRWLSAKRDTTGSSAIPHCTPEGCQTIPAPQLRMRVAR